MLRTVITHHSMTNKPGACMFINTCSSTPPPMLITSCPPTAHQHAPPTPVALTPPCHSPHAHHAWGPALGVNQPPQLIAAQSLLQGVGGLMCIMGGGGRREGGTIEGRGASWCPPRFLIWLSRRMWGELAGELPQKSPLIKTLSNSKPCFDTCAPSVAQPTCRTPLVVKSNAAAVPPVLSHQLMVRWRWASWQWGGGAGGVAGEAE